jgi:Skp family chaperone for outer membrane proteins
MRSLLAGFGLVATLALAPAYANNVAVADSQAAVLASNVAKQTIEGLNSTLQPQRTRLETLRAEITALQDKFTKNGSVMSDKDKQALAAQAQSKLNDYNSTAEGVQKRIEEAQTNMLKTLMPKLETIIEEIRKEGNYDIILEKKYVIWTAPSVDITKKITDRLNAAK